MTRFLYELQVDYFREMSAHLRGLGLKCLITGTNQDFSAAGNRANATCQVMTRNNYWCHPGVRDKPFVTFRNLSMLSSNLANTGTLIASVAGSSVTGKPMMVPEFNMPWPNEFRAEVLPLMAAYGCLQDWDGLLFFAYETRPERDHLTFFGNTRDPVRWGQFPLAAILFHRHDVAAARHTVHIGISRTDAFTARARRGADTYHPYAILSAISKVRNAHFDERYDSDADVVISSGHSASGDYSRARRVVLFSDSDHVDPSGFTHDRGRPARALIPGLQTQTESDGIVTLEPNSLPGNIHPIRQGNRIVGVCSDRFYIVPSASQLGGHIEGRWLHERLLEAYGHWNLDGQHPPSEAGRIFRSDTGELVWNTEQRLFTADTPRFRAAVGVFPPEPIRLGDVSIQCHQPFAAVSLITLDEATTLADADRALITAVSRAKNSGQATIARTTHKTPDNQYLPQMTFELGEPGRRPVIVESVDACIALPWASCSAFALDERGRKKTDSASTAHAIPARSIRRRREALGSSSNVTEHTGRHPTSQYTELARDRRCHRDRPS